MVAAVLVAGSEKEAAHLLGALDRHEARYLDGTRADVPAARRAWDRQRQDSEEAAVMAIRLSELDGAPPAPPNDPVSFEAKVIALAADLVEPAKSKAYNELGDGPRAQTIAAAWLRAGPLTAPSRSTP